jgi:ELWxxDGT repeat protein
MIQLIRAALLAAALPAAALVAQNPRLLIDINRTSTAPFFSSNPAGFCRAGPFVYFITAPDDAPSGLYRTQGSPESTQLVCELPLLQPRFAAETVALGSTLYFAITWFRESFLLRSDGTRAGTWIVHSAPGLEIRGLVATDRALFFRARDPVAGAELWTSDGTGAGTRLVRDVRPGPGDSEPELLTSWGDLCAFRADDGVHGRELWVSDGTPGGTRLLHDAIPGSTSGNPRELRALGAELYYIASGFPYGNGELWSVDRAGAARRVFDGSSEPDETLVSIVHQQRLYCARRDLAHGVELWATGGTAAGTYLVKDIRAGSPSSLPGQFLSTPVGLFFTASEPATGTEVWITDGTEAGTRLVADLLPGPGSSGALAEAAHGRGAFLLLPGNEQWFSDGTAGGTIRLGRFGGHARQGTTDLTGRRLVFAANDGRTGTEPWSSDGTVAGTRQLADLTAPPPGATASGLTGAIASAAGRVWFAADDGVHGQELWATDGTAVTTRLVADLEAGPTGARPTALTGFGDRIVFAATTTASHEEPWISDGTSAGTFLLRDIHPGPYGSGCGDFTMLRDRILFRAFDAGPYGDELWNTDGTPAGTSLLADIHPGTASSWPTGLVRWRNRVWFAARRNDVGNELWSTDGTTAGTVLVRDIAPGPAHGDPGYLAALEGRLLFAATDPSLGNELHSTDGTAAGTKLVADIRPGAIASIPRYLTAANGLVYFMADDGIHGREPWVSDGTAAGTKLLSDLEPGAGFSEVNRFVPLGDRMLFVSAGLLPLQPSHLWSSDGTAGGTRRLLALPSIGAPTPIGSRYALFTAGDHATRQFELWITDGTTAGTRPLAQQIPGSPRITGNHFVLLRNRILFAGTDPVFGTELWQFDPGASSGQVGLPFGANDPRLTATDPVLGGTLRLSIALAPPDRTGLLLLGEPALPLRLGFGAFAQIDPGSAALLAMPRTGADGRALIPLPIDPALAPWAGIPIASQALFPEPASPLGFELTNGLHWTIGR